MKNSIKKLFVLLAIVMSFVAVQSVGAETFEVEGTIVGISEALKGNDGNSEAPLGNYVTIDIDKSSALELVDVYGVGFDRLSNQCDLVLELNDYVVFNVYETECQCGRPILVACGEITVNDETTCDFITDCP